MQAHEAAALTQMVPLKAIDHLIRWRDRHPCRRENHRTLYHSAGSSDTATSDPALGASRLAGDLGAAGAGLPSWVDLPARPGDHRVMVAADAAGSHVANAASASTLCRRRGGWAFG